MDVLFRASARKGSSIGRNIITLLLACDGGATATRAGLYSAERELVAEAAAGPCNPVEHGVDRCVATLVELAGRLSDRPVSVVAAGISGAKAPAFRDAIARGLGAALGTSRVLITDDLHPILFANAGGGDGVLVIAGTGSSVLAQAADGRSVLVGGRGRILGDDGSAYQVAVSGLRAAADALDGVGPGTVLTAALPAAAGVADFSDMVGWAARASKHEIARLAIAVDAVAAQGDAVGRRCLELHAERLAAQTIAAHARLTLGNACPLYLCGGLLQHSTAFRHAYEVALVRKLPESKPLFPRLEGHRAVLELAFLYTPAPEWVSDSSLQSNRYDNGEGETPVEPEFLRVPRLDGVRPRSALALPRECLILSANWREYVADSEMPAEEIVPATEQSLVEAPTLDRLSAIEIVHHMNAQDRRVPEVVARQAPAIAEAIEAVADALAHGGRLIYVGAGTSGRLGALDASECPPTFGVSRDRVIALIAGGDRALRESVEGAEDDTQQGAADVQALLPPLSANDVVVGISASGRTPYVTAALAQAAKCGAATVLVACNPVPADSANIVIALDTGPEVVAGSTRLKAGTATKLVLNMISTGAMALSGHVYNGLMVGMRPINAKLRRRASHMVSALTGLRFVDAERLLDETHGDIRVAVIMARKGVAASAAEALLNAAGGRLRDALEER